MRHRVRSQINATKSTIGGRHRGRMRKGNRASARALERLTLHASDLPVPRGLDPRYCVANVQHLTGERPQIELTSYRSYFGFSGLCDGSATAAMQLQQRITAQPLLIGPVAVRPACGDDDHDMGITHVIRRVDHLTNAARQVQIYAAMEWSVPIFAHVPLIHRKFDQSFPQNSTLVFAAPQDEPRDNRKGRDEQREEGSYQRCLLSGRQQRSPSKFS